MEHPSAPGASQKPAHHPGDAIMKRAGLAPMCCVSLSSSDATRLFFFFFFFYQTECLWPLCAQRVSSSFPQQCCFQINAVLKYLVVFLDANGEGNGNPLQYSCLENPVDRGAWWAAVYGAAQSRTRLKQLSMHALEKEMATHSSILAWRIPGTEEPDGLPSMGQHRVRHD